MSRNDAIERCQSFYEGAPQTGGRPAPVAERMVDFLDDYMRIRYGMQPLDNLAARDFCDQANAKPAFEFVDDRRLIVKIWADGHMEYGGKAGKSVSNVINRIPALVAEAQRDALGPDWKPSESALDRAASIDMELVDPRAIDARDKLQRIMSGLPVSTPHFHELDELLRKLDAMAGQPVKDEQPKFETLDQEMAHILNRPDLAQPTDAEIDEAARNMAPGPDYRPPGAVMGILHTEIDRADWSRLKDVAEELADHVAAGRWEIVSHVPAQRDFAAAFNVEAKRALAKLSVQNPLRNILLKAMSEIELKP